MLRVGLLVIASAFLAAAAPAQRDMVQKLNEQFEQAFERGESARLAQMYTEDAYLMPPQADMVRGRDAIRRFWEGARDQITELKLTAVDVTPLGNDAAREIGTFTAKTKGQNVHQITGKYVVIWQNTGGEWKLATDIWNTNK